MVVIQRKRHIGQPIKTWIDQLKCEWKGVA